MIKDSTHHLIKLVSVIIFLSLPCIAFGHSFFERIYRNFKKEIIVELEARKATMDGNFVAFVTSCTTQHQDFQSLNFITIGNTDNPADGPAYSTIVNGSAVVHNDPNQVGRGAVDYEYSIADRPITTTDWVIYLNTVDANNTNGTFHGNGGNGVRYNTGTGMWVVDALSGMNGGGSVTTNASAGLFPITNISLNQAAHYLNWVNTGNVDSGPYTFVAPNDGNANIATYDPSYVGPRLPFVDEWYKAMFWDQANNRYNLYPTTNVDGNGIPAVTTVDGQGIHADPFAAFYDFPTNSYYAQVGQGTPSPYGLYDGTGNRHDILLNSPTDLSIIAQVGRWQDGEVRQRSSYVEAFASDEATPYLSVGFRPVCGAIPCELNLAYTQASCIDNADGTFTATYDLTLNWENPPAASDLTLTLFGEGTLNTTTVAAATIASGSSTTITAALTVPADGNGNTGVLAAFDTDLTCRDSIGFKAPTPCPNDVPACTSTAGCLGGNVFEDYNCNGTLDIEPGVQGVQINIYDCTNALVGTSYSDSDGDWQVCGLNDGTTYRVEFIMPESISCWATPTHTGVDNGSDIQFVTAPACANFSLSNPMDYCQNDPAVYVSCFVYGPANGNNSALDALVSEPYSERIDDNMPVHNIHATYGQIGATYGLAHHRERNIVYVASFLKRFTGFGPGDVGPEGSTGAIYAIDIDNSNALSVLVDLDPMSPTNPNPTQYSTGPNPHPSSTTDWLVDSASFYQVNRLSWGDIDLSEDGNVLFAMNMFDRAVYEISTTNGAVLGKYTIPGISGGPIWTENTCTNNPQIDLRPMALKYHRGKLFVGITCTSESYASPNSTAARNDLHGYIFEFDPITKNYSPSPIVDFGMGPNSDFYDVNTFSQTGITAWFDETVDWSVNANEIRLNKQIISDIEFYNGDMLIGTRAHTRDIFASVNGTFLPDGVTTPPGANGIGRVLRACYDGINYNIEAGGSCGGIMGFGENVAPPTQNGQIFTYYQQTTAHNQGDYLGALAVLPGNGEISASLTSGADKGAYGFIQDSTFTWRAGGAGVFNVVYTPDDSNFRKVNGLGDIELGCEEAPLEIGNYVWCDSLENGIQDACERGIQGINVSLFDRNGVLVGVTQTSAAGNYYFNENNVDTTGVNPDGTALTIFSGMSYNTQYFIVFGEGQFAAGELNNGSETFGISSVSNTGSNDNIDSDVDGNNLTSGTLGARPDGLPFLDITTNAAGCGDHQYDLGLTCNSCTITDANVMNIACNDNNTLSNNADDYITFSLNPAGADIGSTYNVTVNTGIISPITGNYGVATNFQLQNGSAGTGNVTVTIIDNNDNSCVLNVLITDPGNCGASVDYPDFNVPTCPNTACHIVNTDLMLGTTISIDSTPMIDSTATADDDDGVLFPNNLRPSTQIRLQIQVTNNTGNDAHLYGWADWNDDGDFDDMGENIIASTYSNSGIFTISAPVSIPTSPVLTSEIAMRFRISTDQPSVIGPCGPPSCAPDGEVEDYLIQLECPPTICLPMQVQTNRS